MLFNRYYLQTLFSFIICTLLFLTLTCTSSDESEPTRQTVSAKEMSNDSLQNKGSSYHLDHLNYQNYDVILSASGLLSITSVGDRSQKISLFQDTSLLLKKVNYITFQNDLIVFYECEKGDSSWSEIARISLKENAVIWKTGFGGDNISQAVTQGRFLYGSTLGYIGKVDLKKGKIAWKKDDLWEKHKINNFERIVLVKDTVVFIGTIYEINDKTTMVRKTVPFKYYKRNGREIKQSDK